MSETYTTSGPYTLPDKPDPADSNGLGRIVDGIPYCADCGSRLFLRRNADPMERFFGCSGFPKCRGSLGCYLDGSPRGIPGNEEVRQARIRAHSIFDYLWKTRILTRDKSYQWLAAELGMSVEEAHISNFGLKECQKTIEACQALYRLNDLTKILRTIRRKLRNK